MAVNETTVRVQTDATLDRMVVFFFFFEQEIEW
jgi:hypothetical protein